MSMVSDYPVPSGVAPGQPHVLVIDDSPDVLALLADVFTDEGYRVSTSPVPLTVPEIQAYAPDIVVHDVLGSHVSAAGWGQVMRLRADPRLAAVSIIVCTADTRARTDSTLQRDLAALDIPVILKPFLVDALLAMARAACGLAMPGEAPPDAARRAAAPEGSASPVATLGPVMDAALQVEVGLLPHGRVSAPDGQNDPTAVWQVLGTDRHEGTTEMVIRVELAGATWLARVPGEAAARSAPSRTTTITRLSAPRTEPLQGWILFC